MNCTTLSRPKIRDHDVIQKIGAFSTRFGKAHLFFAYHAAFPIALTPDLLYCLWANFQRDVSGQCLDIPWIAVADLLLSGLLDEVGYEIYEMDMEVRKILLSCLEENKNFGQQRINELSNFLSAYVQSQLQSNDPEIRDFAQAQQWTALAYRQPRKAVRELALTLATSYQQSPSELMRTAAIIEALEKPLTQFKSLVSYARGISQFACGNQASAVDTIGKLCRNEKQLKIAGIILPVPETIKTSLRTQTKATSLTLTNINQPKLHNNIIFRFGQVAVGILAIMFPAISLLIPKSLETGNLVSATEFYQQCSQHYSLQEYRKAIKDCDRELKNNPNSLAAAVKKGLALEKLKGSETAKLIFETVSIMEAKSAEDWYYRGLAFDRLGKKQDAIAAFQKAIWSQPNYVDAWHYRGNIQLQLKQYLEAVNSFKQATKIQPDRIESWYQLGNAQFTMKQYSEAIYSYEKALQNNPDYLWVLYKKGLAHRHLNQHSQARETYRITSEKARNVDSTDAKLWHNLGKELHNFQDNRRAAMALEKALKYDPENFDACYLRGYILYHLGEYEGALDALNIAVKLEPQSTEAVRYKGLTQFALGHPRAAAKTYGQFLRKRPDSPDVLIEQGKVLMEIQECDRATISFKKARTIEPSGSSGIAAQATNGLADIEKYCGPNVGEQDKLIVSVLKIFGTLFKSTPPSQKNCKKLIDSGKITVQQLLDCQQYEIAQTILEERTKTYPEDADAWEALGKAYLGLKQYEKAISAFEKSEEIDPGGFNSKLHYNRAKRYLQQTYEIELEVRS